MTNPADAPRLLKIVHVIARLNIGGSAQHVIYLTEKMNDGPFRTILVKGAESETEGTMEGLARGRGVEFIFISELGRKIQASDDWVAFRELLRLLRKERPDILHTHTAKAGALGRMAGWVYRWTTPGGRGLKIFHTFHGHVLHSYFGPLKTWIFRWMERILASISTCVITLSEGLRGELESFRVACREKIRVVPLGLELSEFAGSGYGKGDGGDATFRRSLGVPHEAFVAGMVGRLVPIKDHETFFEASRMLIDEGMDLHLLIVGDGELRASLERRAADLLAPGRAHFAGWRFDLPRMYREMDAVVLCSLNEGTPVSLIEAMAASRPIVATGVGGVPDLLGWGEKGNPPLGSFAAAERGWIISPRDPAGLAAALREIRERPERNLTRATAGRDYALEHFSIERLVANLTALYRGG